MVIVRIILFSLFLFLIDGAVGASLSSNEELRKIKLEDQLDRQTQPVDWSSVTQRDNARRVQVVEILRIGAVRTAEDYYNAALVFQHGDTPADIRIAFSLATTAAAIEPNDKRAKWLAAAAWDRLMVYLGRPQWYGTQYRRLDNGMLELDEIDETAVSDADRVANGVPPLAEVKARATLK